jgi:hypothetical protein
MNPIESFISLGKRLSLTILLDAHCFLSNCHFSKNWIQLEDVEQAVLSSSKVMEETDVDAYVALLLESLLVPALTANRQIALKMHRDVVNQEAIAMKNILECIYAISKDGFFPMVDEFYVEAQMYLNSKACSGVGNEHLVTSTVPSLNHSPTDFSAATRRVTPRSNLMRSGVEEYAAPTGAPINYVEKAEPIIKLLAHVRKVGMDIIFPQITHDKVCVEF